MVRPTCTRALYALIVGAAVLAGCPAGQSSRCRDLCQGVVECIESLDSSEQVIDENECTTACTSLERDPEGKAMVDRYAVCVRDADGCENKLRCSAPSANDRPRSTRP